jgi:hypothetical protein
MTHNSFFIHLLYGAVILAVPPVSAGRTVSALQRDERQVYMYIGTLRASRLFVSSDIPDFPKERPMTAD